MLGDPLEYEGSLFTHPFDLVDEDGQPLELSDIPSVRTLRTGETLSGFVMGVRSSDYQGTVWLTVATQPLRDDDGTITGVICTFFDTTPQRRRASRAAARRRSGSGSSPRTRPTSSIASRSASRRSFDYVNPAVEAVLGYTPQEFYDDPSLIVKVTHDDDIDAGARRSGTKASRRCASVQLRMTTARRHADLDRAQGGAAAQLRRRGDRRHRHRA